MGFRAKMAKGAVLGVLAALTMAMAGCATQTAMPQDVAEVAARFTDQAPEPFAYEKDIWSDREWECREAIYNRFLEDIADSGYPLAQDEGLSFTLSTLETSEAGTDMVIRGMVTDAETGASNFVKLTYRLGDPLAEAASLERWDSVQNAKFFVDIGDNLADLTLEKLELNRQIDARDFYENYGDFKENISAPGGAYEQIAAMYNYLTDSGITGEYDGISGIADGSIHFTRNEAITFVGECAITEEENGRKGNLSVDSAVGLGTYMPEGTKLAEKYYAARFRYATNLIQGDIEPDITAEEFVELASYSLMDVQMIHHVEADACYGCDGGAVLERNVKLTGVDAKESINNFKGELRDKQIRIPEFSTMTIDVVCQW